MEDTNSEQNDQNGSFEMIIDDNPVESKGMFLLNNFITILSECCFETQSLTLICVLIVLLKLKSHSKFNSNF